MRAQLQYVHPLTFVPYVVFYRSFLASTSADRAGRFAGIGEMAERALFGCAVQVEFDAGEDVAGAKGDA